MDDLNLIALAIPFFFVLIGAEILVARWQGRSVYRVNDAIADLGCGIGQQVSGVFATGVLLALYTLVYDNLRVGELHGLTAWLVAFFLVDLAYYWWHRASHRINLLWAAHVVHHQSQDYNLAVALRQSMTTRFTMLPFMLPLALLGVHPLVFLSVDAINTLYQFWIHTRTVGRLGPLEWVINTPSAHRVHHGINPRYIDKNYGGVFIVFDRMFGTFEREEEPVVYGTVKRFESFDPIRAQFETWLDLALDSLAAPRWVDKWRLWLAPPEWTPAGLPPRPQITDVHPSTFEKFDVPMPPGLGAYVVLQLVPVALALVLLLWIAPTAPFDLQVALATGILFSTWVWGALFEARPWAVGAEVVRLLGGFGAAALVVVQRPDLWLGAMLALPFLAASLLWVLHLRGVAVGAPTVAPAQEI